MLANSNESNVDIDNYYARNIKEDLKKQLFIFSKGLKRKDRILLFRKAQPEFSKSSDDHINILISIYDHNFKQEHKASDPALSVIGTIILWFCWLFSNTVMGQQVVEFTN